MSVEPIRRFCLSFPHATENLQWGDDLCFKVGGKIFALLSLSSVPQRLMFKCKPETFAELVEHEDIIPAPYLGRYKWVAFQRLDVLPWSEVEGLDRAVVPDGGGEGQDYQRQHWQAQRHQAEAKSSAHKGVKPFNQFR